MIDLDKLTPAALLDYYTYENGESELFDLVPLLPLATGSRSEALKILEKIRKGAKLVAYYPAEGGEQPKGELLGTIYDGALYLING